MAEPPAGDAIVVAARLGTSEGTPWPRSAGQTLQAELVAIDGLLWARGKELVGLHPGCHGGCSEGVVTRLGTRGCLRLPSSLRERPAPEERVMPRMLVGCRGDTPRAWGPDPPPAPLPPGMGAAFAFYSPRMGLGAAPAQPRAAPPPRRGWGRGWRRGWGWG